MRRLSPASVSFSLLTLMMGITPAGDLPRLLTFQGSLRDTAGTPLTGQYETTFRMYDTESGGTPLWTETATISCERGLFTTTLGLATPIDLPFDAQYWLAVQVGADTELTPRYRLGSVPAAFRAGAADQMSWTGLTDLPAGFADGTDDVGPASGISQINPGPGINVAQPTGPTATVAVDIGSGADQVAAGNHDHDADYVAQGQASTITGSMIADGTIQEVDLGFTPGGDMDWTIIGDTIYHQTGNVGIGTATPAHRLDVLGTIRGTNPATDGIGVYGHAVFDEITEPPAVNFGGYFVAEAMEGVAVYGHAPYTQEGYVDRPNHKRNYGGYFQADGMKGIGVYGRATRNAGNNINYGGYFQSDGSYGVGVYGEGARGDGIGVMGVATNLGTYGGKFIADGSYATGVLGEGTRYGGSFHGSGQHSYGVMCHGEYIGVYSSSNHGPAGVFYSESGTGLIVHAPGESLTQGNLTRLLTYAGINLETEYLANAYTPGLFWSTSNNQETKPKAGIYLKESGSGTSMYFGTSNNYSIGITNDALVLQYNGNVGIGRTSPAYKLDVDGTIRGSNVSPSDVRLKRDIVTIADALRKVTSLRGAQFRWADREESRDLQMGLIAQEVEEVFPEAVSTDAEGIKSVAYERLVAPLIEAIKQQQVQIRALEREVEQLKAGAKSGE